MPFSRFLPEKESYWFHKRKRTKEKKKAHVQTRFAAEKRELTPSNYKHT